MGTITDWLRTFELSNHPEAADAYIQMNAAADRIASLEAENARLRRINEIQKAALDRYAPCGGHAGKAPGGCLACAAERQLAEARRLLKEAVPTVAKIRDSMATHWLERVAALAPAEKPASDGEGPKPHDWGPSQVCHGEQQCRRCLITNREAAVLGRLNKCQP